MSQTSDMSVLTGVDSSESATMVDTLGAKLSAHGTVFIDAWYKKDRHLFNMVLFSLKLVGKDLPLAAEIHF